MAPHSTAASSYGCTTSNTTQCLGTPSKKTLITTMIHPRRSCVCAMLQAARYSTSSDLNCAVCIAVPVPVPRAAANHMRGTPTVRACRAPSCHHAQPCNRYNCTPELEMYACLPTWCSICSAGYVAHANSTHCNTAWLSKQQQKNANAASPAPAG